MKKLFVILFTVFLAVPAFAQTRGRGGSSATGRTASRPAPRPAPRVVVRPRVVVTRPYYYRPYYRSYGYRYYGGGYYGGYYGDGYGYGYYRSHITGLKFNLDLVSKDERELVKKSIVQIDGAEIGIVNRHDGWWNGAIPVSAGDHEVVVEHPDGRVFRTQIFVQEGQTLHVYLRFKP